MKTATTSRPRVTRDRSVDALGWIVSDELHSIQFSTFDAATEAVRAILEAGSFDEYLYGGDEWEGPTCSICDALGHGYPGGGPCPLEERGWQEAMWEAEREAGLR